MIDLMFVKSKRTYMCHYLTVVLTSYTVVIEEIPLNI